MVKCDICGQMTDKTYPIPFVDDVHDDGDGPQASYSTHNVCSSCVPEDFVDVLNDNGQQIMQNLLTSKW